MKQKRFRFLSCLIILSILITLLTTACGSSGSNSQQSSEQSPTQSQEQQIDYPKKQIEFIVAYSAGGGSDVGARILASAAEKTIGQPITVVNKPGAGGAIGFTAIQTAKPDGYTIGLINIPSLVLLPLQNEVSYSVENIEPIIQLVEDPGLLIVKKDGKFKSLEDFINFAKENPGKLTMGNCGVGSDIHMATVALAQAADIDIEPIPYGGTVEAVTAVIGGHIDSTMAKLSEAVGPLENEQVIALAALTNERIPDYPDLPTLKELGIDIGVDVSSSRGVAVPAGTPKEIKDILHEKLKAATEDPEYIEKMKQAGLTIKYRNGEDFKKFIDEQNSFYAEMVNKLGLGKK